MSITHGVQTGSSELNNVPSSLLSCLTKIAQLQGESLDRLSLQEAAQTTQENVGSSEPKAYLVKLLQTLHLATPNWMSEQKLDPSHTPVLIYSTDDNWGVLRGKNAAGYWVVQYWNNRSQQWNEKVVETLNAVLIAQLKLAKPYAASSSTVYNLIRNEILSRKKLLRDALLASIVINAIGVAVAMYTMLVYDRVIPTGAVQTLFVLTCGVGIAIVYEFISKVVRSKLFERMIMEVDQRMARSVYTRFLAVRLDQLPQSVGGLAAQMRGYETIRSFLVGVTSHVLVDAPYAMVFILLVYLIGGYLALIPLSFFILCIVVGVFYKGRVTKLAASSNVASAMRSGLLVETIEGAEAIKSGQGGWRMLSRWMDNTDSARDHELHIRRIGERSQFLVASFQQLSYVSLIASGALLVSQGELTLGALIACSILSGRILTPVATIPNQLIQWAHTKAAMKMLDALWMLEDDHYGQERPLVIDNICGSYLLKDVVVNYGELPALKIPNLTIKQGEKVAIVGAVGSGKTTLLRLLSGLYRPQEGCVLLDGIDLSHIAKPKLAENLSYVQQEVRLFSGTVRDNLILGLMDPGDDAILSVAKASGLFETVLAGHPKGLYRPIFEGGTGLSGGQKQLLNITRALLRDSKIWLLDEPTAAMDQGLETKVLKALKSSVGEEHTFVLVTHKAELLSFVDRIIVVAGQTIAMDGPKDVVLAKLSPSNIDSLASSRTGNKENIVPSTRVSV